MVYVVSATGFSLQVLLLKRTVGRGGFWQPITGGVNYGETNYQAATRELMEETGFANVTSFILGRGFDELIHSDDLHNFEDGSDRLLWMPYLCIVGETASPNLDKREHCEWKWCDAQLAKKLLTRQCDIEVLRSFLTYVETQMILA